MKMPVYKARHIEDIKMFFSEKDRCNYAIPPVMNPLKIVCNNLNGKKTLLVTMVSSVCRVIELPRWLH